MERDSFRLAWRTAPGAHAAALLAIALAAVLGWLALDLVRVALDDLAGDRGRGPLLRLALALPGRPGEPWLVFEGIRFERERWAAALLGLLAGLAAGGGLLALLVQWLRARIGARVLARLRRWILEALVAARSSARPEAGRAVALAAEGASRQAGHLGGAWLDPAASGAAMAVALGFALGCGWPLAAAMLSGLVLQALALLAWSAAERRRAEQVQADGAALARAGADLVRRLPAVRAHGTEAFEHRRLKAEFRLRRQARWPAERQAALASGLVGLAALAAPAASLAAGFLAALPVGSVAAVALAGFVAGRAVERMAAWSRGQAEAAGFLADLAASLAPLKARRSARAAAALPGSGVLRAAEVSAFDPATGGRVSGLAFSVALPAHLALVGEALSGAGVLAALIGGRIEPSAGRLTLEGIDLAASGEAAQARTIAFAGPDPILVPGTLRANLVYGCAGSPDSLDERLIAAIAVAGLDPLVHTRGMAGTVDPAAEPDLAAHIVEARRAVRERLAASGRADLVDPFDRGRFNQHATIAENILFGVPRGDALREPTLAGHPFLRAVLEAEGLTKPMLALGLAIAASMGEIFADLPDDHPLFRQYALFPARERGYFADLVARGGRGRRGAAQARDRERLIRLALRYDESRHRLDLLDAELKAGLLRARASFCALLPASLQPAIAFYEPDALNPAASLKDNLLFGRVAHDRAGAEAEVQEVLRLVLAERGLDADVLRIGLGSRVDPAGGGLLPSQIAAIDLARCLVREAPIVVVEGALAGLRAAEADGLVRRLRRALAGRTLILATPDLTPPMDEPPFDQVLRFDRGAIVARESRGGPAPAAPAEAA